ncbi:MAG TPA: hypothetical protein VLB81_12510 [Gaiellales bacterium]|nr:hypothetical protein [Gaiellales bacterium]
MRRWNDEAFRPAAVKTYLLGSDDVGRHLTALVDSYNRALAGEGSEIEFQTAEREKMIDAMRKHLTKELERTS